MLAFVTAHGPSKRADIASGAGLSVSRTSQLLGELAREGAIVAEGSTRNRVYRASR